MDTYAALLLDQTMPNIRYLTVIIILLTLLDAARPGKAQDNSPLDRLQPDGRFGAVESYYRTVDAVEAGVRFQRIIFEWRLLQPNGPDDWDTSHLPDKWLEDARRNGLEVIGLVKNAPYWATGTKLLGAVPLGVTLPVDNPANLWAAFIKKLVRYYSEKWDIHHWIIYNEPDLRPENGTFFEFAGTV